MDKETELNQITLIASLYYPIIVLYNTCYISSKLKYNIFSFVVTVYSFSKKGIMKVSAVNVHGV